MLSKLFKKKLSFTQAAGELVSILLRAAKDDWKDDKETLSTLSDELDDSSDSFELFLATIAMELLVAKNMNTAKYKEVFNGIIETLGKVEGLGDYSIRSIELYMSSAGVAELRGQSPDEGIIKILAERLDIKLDIVSGLTIRTLLLSKLGIWKFLNSHFKMVE